MMKERVKALWKLCFDDTEEFVEMYFCLRYREELNVGIQEGEEVVSALQLIPYPMTFCGQTVQTSYISGACTHPHFRGKGVMRQLLAKSFYQMRADGVHFGTLIPAEPWLFNYYAGVGYTPAFQYSKEEVSIPINYASEDSSISTITEYQEDIYLYIYRKLAERSCCIQHTSIDFQAIMEDLMISNGILLAARGKEGIAGILIGYQEEEQFIINELFAENEATKQNLLYALGQHAITKKIIRLLPPDGIQPAYPLGMARIIRVKEVLQLYASAFPEQEMLLKVSDEQLPENNGYYHLHKGICTFSSESLPGIYTSIDISELTELILQPLRPYMSLMMN